jgi:hypothetical protein
VVISMVTTASGKASLLASCMAMDSACVIFIDAPRLGDTGGE